MMTRADKAQEISRLSEKFGKAKAAYLIDFKGMDVEQVTNLRKKLHPLDSEMRVVRNTLAKLALNDYPEIKAAISDEFVGTNAVVFAYDDVSAPAKTLKDFMEDVEHLEMKSGVMDGKKLDSDGVRYLATLPSKEVLRGQLLGIFAAPTSKFVRTLNEVPSKFARLLGAYKDQKG